MNIQNEKCFFVCQKVIILNPIKCKETFQDLSVNFQYLLYQIVIEVLPTQ